MQTHSPLFHNLVTLGDIRSINSISLPGPAHFRRFLSADGDDLISSVPADCRVATHRAKEWTQIRKMEKPLNKFSPCGAAWEPRLKRSDPSSSFPPDKPDP